MAAQVQGTQVYETVPGTRETWALAVASLPRVAVMQGDRPGVTFSGTPGQTKSIVVAGITISGIPQPDNGQGALKSTVDTTGTFEFPVVGGSSAAQGGDKVYFVTADGTLTLTVDGTTPANTPFFGIVNLPEGYLQHGTVLPVKIGVVA